MIRAISRDEVLKGLGRWIHCCMFGSEEQGSLCAMWGEVFDEAGGIGFLAREHDEVIGQLIFIPKKHARRIAIPTSAQAEGTASTLVIGCLCVRKEYANYGIASEMIRFTLEFARSRGYSRVEACVDTRSPDESGMTPSYYPFRKFGFVLDETREGWESRPETRMCWVQLDGEKAGAGGRSPFDSGDRLSYTVASSTVP